MYKDDSNSLDIYFEDIKRYPILSTEEQNELGKKLKIVNDLHIVNRDNKKELDLEHIFSSLYVINDIDEINDILSIIIKVGNISKNQKIINNIFKYKKIFNDSNCALSFEELNKYFGYCNTTQYIDKIELYTELKQYLIYLDAREKLINSNLRLVFSVAKKFSKSQYDFSDLICEGNMGLVIAVDKFDSDKNVKFSTYAVYWIKEKIMRFIYSNNSILSFSEGQLLKAIKFNEDVQKLEQENNRKYSIDELKKIFRLDRNTIYEYLNFCNFTMSLDQPINEEEDTTLGELIENEEELISTKVDNLFLKDELKSLIEELDEREQTVLNLRFGLTNENCSGYTLEEIAKALNITVEKVRQIEAKAIRKIRDRALKKGKYRSLKLYLYDE